MSKTLKCPSCGSKAVQLIKHQGEEYPQCAACKFWTTKVSETWKEGEHGG